MIDPPAGVRPEHADVLLDRIAAFTDEMTELLAADRRSGCFPGEPENSTEAAVLIADCKKLLRAVAAISGSGHPTPCGRRSGHRYRRLPSSSQAFIGMLSGSRVPTRTRRGSETAQAPLIATGQA